MKKTNLPLNQPWGIRSISYGYFNDATSYPPPRPQNSNLFSSNENEQKKTSPGLPSVKENRVSSKPYDEIGINS